MDSGMLDVPGARLYYEVRGSGPVLLVILGGGADAAMAAPMAEILAGRHTVITYDRRGAARRLLPGDTVWVPPGERHWHGASETTLMTHTAISIGPTRWHDEVAAGDYARAHNVEESA
ncbi:hypothetical protein AB0M50_38400 [Nonomuraea fuscirosea]|uniref:hypothetical protein n=1 Tax=Nonomuraea fuscirosea TaxID=1291556 RepID=UPI00342C918C